MSIPSFQRTAGRLRAEQAAFQLAQSLRVAHEQAVVGSREVRWAWDRERLRAHLAPVAVEDAEGEDAASPDAPGPSDSAALPAGTVVTVREPPAAAECACVRFFPQGTSEAAVLAVSIDAHPFTIAVDAATSHIRLTAGSAAR